MFSILFGHIVELRSNVWSNYVLLFSIMFGSLDWLPKFCLAGNYIGRLIYDFCFYYSYRILFGSMELCSASGLEPREKKRTGSPGTGIFSRAFIIYSNYYQCLCAVQCKRKLTNLHDSYSSWHLYICSDAGVWWLLCKNRCFPGLINNY